MTSSFRDRHQLSRRAFLGATATAGAAAVLLGPGRARGAARYTRYNATSPQGQAMLKSYAVAINKMLALPPGHPHNWFRNAFVHTLDCPHGNWWFFAWHRGYVGYFERTIRALSGNPDFAMPYWDWTQLPRIPDTMFDGVLTPTNVAFNPYIVSYQTFFDYMNPALTAFWKARTPGQVAQLKLREMPTLDAVWKQVKDNPMYATTNDARYLTRDNPALDPKVAKMCAPETILSGLAPRTFIPFNSNKTTSHTVPPSQSTVFSILEGQPHNNVHNNIGGVGHVDAVHFGYMQDNLSPTDPVFFLHHSNMDRLWQIWIKKQEKLGLPTLPEGADKVAWENDPFLFFVDERGQPVTAKAGDYATIGAFDYDYEPAFGDDLVAQPPAAAAAPAKPQVAAKSTGPAGKVAVGAALVNEAAAGGAGKTLVAKITVPHPTNSAQRNFDVLVNAPAGVTAVDADSPYYAGTIAFFGAMRHGAMEVTFTVPLTKVLANLKAANALGTGELQFRVVPQAPAAAAPSPQAGAPKKAAAVPASRLKAVAVEVW